MRPYASSLEWHCWTSALFEMFFCVLRGWPRSDKVSHWCPTARELSSSAEPSEPVAGCGEKAWERERETETERERERERGRGGQCVRGKRRGRGGQEMSSASRKRGEGASDELVVEHTHMNATPVQCTHSVPTFTHSLSIHPWAEWNQRPNKPKMNHSLRIPFLMSSVLLFVFYVLYSWVSNEWQHIKFPLLLVLKING